MSKQRAIKDKTAADAAAVVEQFGLTTDDEIRFLKESQIRCVPGVGTVRFNRLRAAYPFDVEASAAREAEDLEKWRADLLVQKCAQAASRQRHLIDLGTLYKVRSVHFENPFLIITSEKGEQTQVIGIYWARDVPVEKRHPQGCFGPSNSPGLPLISLPQLGGVLSVDIVSRRVDDDGRMSTLNIVTQDGTFELTLFSRHIGDSALGREEVTERSSSDDFVLELRSAPDVAAAERKVARACRRAEEAIRLGDTSSALRAYCSVQTHIALILREAAKLAAVREFPLEPEVFGLTGADADETEFDTSMIFYSDDQEEEGYASPVKIAGSIMRHLLDRDEEEAARSAIAKFLEVSTWMNDAQRERLMHCLTILDELKSFRLRIAEAGIAGITRKSIVADFDRRYPSDDGMARRAVLRWISFRENEIMKVSAPKGVLFRTCPKSST